MAYKGTILSKAEMLHLPLPTLTDLRNGIGGLPLKHHGLMQQIVIHTLT